MKTRQNIEVFNKRTFERKFFTVKEFIKAFEDTPILPKSPSGRLTFFTNLIDGSKYQNTNVVVNISEKFITEW